MQQFPRDVTMASYTSNRFVCLFGFVFFFFFSFRFSLVFFPIFSCFFVFVFVFFFLSFSFVLVLFFYYIFLFCFVSFLFILFCFVFLHTQAYNMLLIWCDPPPPSNHPKGMRLKLFHCKMGVILINFCIR